MAGLNVRLEVGLPVGPVRAQRALERLDPRVDLQVPLQVRLAIPAVKPLAAGAARELPPGLAAVAIRAPALGRRRRVVRRRVRALRQEACARGRRSGLSLKHKSKAFV